MRLPHPLAIEAAEHMRSLAIFQRLHTGMRHAERLNFRRRQSPLNIDRRNAKTSLATPWSAGNADTQNPLATGVVRDNPDMP
jgi:hypothetical protein